MIAAASSVRMYTQILTMTMCTALSFCGCCCLQWWDNKPYQGALANNPLWEQQIQYYNAWFAANSYPYITIHDSKFLNLPGAYNSSFRFIRAAKLPEAGYIWQW